MVEFLLILYNIDDAKVDLELHITVFRFVGSWWGESIGHQWIILTKDQ